MAKAADPGKLCTVVEIAEKMNASTKTVRRIVAKRQIAVTYVGDLVRISEAAYNDWCRRNTVDPVL